jgi:hypothetical protein
MAKIIKIGTKKADELIYDFNRTYYKGVTLYDVYGTCSAKKRSSWAQIRRTCEEPNGWNLHITGASCHQYSCMYAFKNEDGNIVLRKETSCNTYDLVLTPEEYDRVC